MGTSPPTALPDPQGLSLLILSDVHFGKLSISPQFALPGCSASHSIQNAAPMKDHLIQTIREMSLLPSAILVLGDLTSVASPSEFLGSVAVIRDVARAVGTKDDMVLFTYGNHDVNWRVSALANAAGPFPEDLVYKNLAAQIGGLYATNPPRFEAGPLPGSGIMQDDRFMLITLNSGSFCTSDQDYQHGKLGTDQFHWLKTVLARSPADARWRLLMVHHHPFAYTYPTVSKDISTLEEGAELVDLAGQHGIDLVCHGHRHHPKHSTQMRNGWKRPTTYFCAGSLAVNETERNSGQIPNLFHVLSLESRLACGGAFGNIRTFEYAASDGWRPIRFSTETPLDHVQYFGALASDAELAAIADTLVSEQAARCIDERCAQVLLPKHPQLPPSLRCQTLLTLNHAIKKAAQQKHHRIVGAYPDDVALMHGVANAST